MHFIHWPLGLILYMLQCDLLFIYRDADVSHELARCAREGKSYIDTDMKIHSHKLICMEK